MKTEINIILEKGSSNKAKGNCFETLIRNVLSTHQYKIRQNLRFTGMELDLVAEHKQRKNEVLYVECKAKEKVSSSELRTFFANVFHHKADFGYFFRTKELESDAGGLLSEYRSDERYKNLTFFEPEDIIDALVDGQFAFEPNDINSKYKISKKILNVSYFGDFFVYVINESNLLPTHFLIINAIDNNKIVSKEDIEKIKEEIPELQGLESVQYSKSETIENISKQEKFDIETIAEVQEGEKWFDPLPASYTYKNFVGRDTIRGQILDFFNAVQNNETEKRIFYLNGKSGWGKSSLVSEIKGRCRNKYYKNKYYTVAIDTRSATSNNFVALSLERLIRKAIDDKFISTSKVHSSINFTSSVDLLSSDSVKSVINELERKNRYLILIFDQFEDVFRKEDLFKSFYKFLSDITDKKPNIIVGFSWKTEIVIPIEHEAYSYWQQAKSQAKEFTIGEFGEKEIDGVIKQLEKSIGKLDKSIKNRIKENSQGLPWFTKKLCIHIYQQIETGGIKKDKLIEYNLNIKELFESDKEKVVGDELFALNHIAKKAYDGDFFDVSDIGDVISNKTIESLLNQRLIIRSGANYNIYWDVFRDYLVTGEIPTIGESYLMRQGVKLCFEVFMLFDGNLNKETVDSLLEKHAKNIGKTSLENILIELRNIGLVKKNDDFYFIAKSDIEISEKGFNNFIFHRFQNYTPYLLLKNDNLDTISKEDIKRVLQKTIKNEYQDETWDAYSKNLIGWFLSANLDISDRILEPKKGRSSFTKLEIKESKDKILPKSSLKEIINCVELLKNGNEIQPKYSRDLLLFGLIDDKRNITENCKSLFEKKVEDIKLSLVEEALKLPKMRKVAELMKENGKLIAKELVNRFDDDFFDGKKISSKELYASKVLTWINKSSR